MYINFTYLYYIHTKNTLYIMKSNFSFSKNKQKILKAVKITSKRLLITLFIHLSRT